MAMNCTGVLYFPITISLLEGVATELIEARFGLKGVAAFIKLLGKIYKEEGYYLVWNKEQCMLFVPQIRKRTIGRGNAGNRRTSDKERDIRPENV